MGKVALVKEGSILLNKGMAIPSILVSMRENSEQQPVTMAKHDGKIIFALSILFTLSLARLSASTRPSPSPMKKFGSPPPLADSRNPGRFAGKTFIVTGGTSGVGKTISLQLAREGAAAVTIVGRSEARGAAVVEQVRAP